jgi:sec-independent protein translocase protein TatA
MITYEFIDHSSFVSFMGQVGPWQIAVIVIVVLLFFGGKKIPELMKGLGQGIKSFKDGMKGEEDISKKDDSKER